MPDEDGWIDVDLTAAIEVNPGEKYRLLLAADRNAPNPDTSFVWSGRLSSNPYPAGDSSLEASWAGFDFAFRTFGDDPPHRSAEK